MSLIDALVDAQAEAAGWPKPAREYRFHDTRRWRFDYAWEVIWPQQLDRKPPPNRVALEVQGGVWTGGKHGRGAGIVKDFEKLNHAQALGWRVIQMTPGQVKGGELLKALKLMSGAEAA